MGIFEKAVAKGKKALGDSYNAGADNDKHEVQFTAYKGTEDEEEVEFSAKNDD